MWEKCVLGSVCKGERNVALLLFFVFRYRCVSNKRIEIALAVVALFLCKISYERVKEMGEWMAVCERERERYWKKEKGIVIKRERVHVWKRWTDVPIEIKTRVWEITREAKRMRGRSRVIDRKRVRPIHRGRDRERGCCPKRIPKDKNFEEVWKCIHSIVVVHSFIHCVCVSSLVNKIECRNDACRSRLNKKRLVSIDAIDQQTFTYFVWGEV